jgi:hypothetical protein
MSNYTLVFNCDGTEYIFNSHNVEITHEEIQMQHGGMMYSQYSPHNHNIVIDIEITHFSWNYLTTVMDATNNNNGVDMMIMCKNRTLDIKRGLIESIVEEHDRCGSYIKMKILYDQYIDIELPLIDIRRKKIMKLLSNIKKESV